MTHPAPPADDEAPNLDLDYPKDHTHAIAYMTGYAAGVTTGYRHAIRDAIGTLTHHLTPGDPS